MAYVSHSVGSVRYFDHVYDPMFEMSSQKDVWKTNVQALHKSAPVQIMSIYNTMFSDMPNRPNYQCWKRQNPLPHYPHPGAMTKTSKYMQAVEQRKQISVIGACRSNFFHHPADHELKTMNLKLSLPPDCKCIETPTNKYQTVACQTLYRESSTQTKPYLPDYYIAQGEPETPEIARIANLFAGTQTPGEFEANVIERSRRRRQWEKELRPTTSLKEWDQRKTVLEAFEWEEFLAREEDIQEMQELRMDLVRNLMTQREASMRASSAVKLQNTTQRIEKEKRVKLKKINQTFNRNMRKLEMARRNISRKYKVTDIVTEHKDKASDLYAPQMRFGIHPKRSHFVPFKSSFQARLDNLAIRTINPKLIKCPIKKYDRLAKPKATVTEIEKGFNNEDHLTVLYEALKTLRDTANTSKGLPKCLDKIHKEASMAAETPLGPSDDLYESTETHCCIYLQKIIKGRAVQKIIYNGRNRSRGLIEEIQTTYLLSAVSEMYPGLSNDTIRGRLCVQSQQKRFAQEKLHHKKSEELFKEADAGTLGVLLEFLEKELRRMCEQRKIHALCILAERERMKREAAEAERRQTETWRRNECEEIYRQMTKASHNTVSLYLENLLIEEADQVADHEARERIQTMAKRIDQEVSKSLDPKCQLSQDVHNVEVIDNLVKDIMFPEVQKQIARRKTEERRKQHLLAAHETLYGQIENIFQSPTPRDSGSEIASHILNNLIDKVLSCDSVLSKLGRHENVAQHEALSAIRKIMQRVFPLYKWKTSSEQITSTMVSQLIESGNEHPERKLADEKSWLEEITTKITENFWKYTLEESQIDGIGENTGQGRSSFLNYERSKHAEAEESVDRIYGTPLRGPQYLINTGEVKVEFSHAATENHNENIKALHSILSDATQWEATQFEPDSNVIHHFPSEKDQRLPGDEGNSTVPKLPSAELLKIQLPENTSPPYTDITGNKKTDDTSNKVASVDYQLGGDENGEATVPSKTNISNRKKEI